MAVRSKSSTACVRSRSALAATFEFGERVTMVPAINYEIGYFQQAQNKTKHIQQQKTYGTSKTTLALPSPHTDRIDGQTPL
jgi:hypothetical protein